MRAAGIWSLTWIACALIFAGMLWVYFFYTATPAIAQQKFLEFLTGYLIEKSLSIDNLFAFYMVFHYFRIPIDYQRRVLVYGIGCAVIMRLLLILLGVWLVSQFHWVLYLLGLFLLVSGVKMLFLARREQDLKDSIILQWLQKHLRLTKELHANKFFVRHGGLLYFTPLFLALILVEVSDLVFALDSIPAIFAVTQDPLIVWTANIFAILGLRALYFLLAQMADRFALLKYGVAFIIIFVGVKMLIEPWIVIPLLFSLGVVIGVLGLFILVNILLLRRVRG